MRSKLIIRATVVIAAALMIAAGVSAGVYKDVLSRAVMICLECVGIG